MNLHLTDFLLPLGGLAFVVLVALAVVLIVAHQITERRGHDGDDETWPPDAPPPAELERVNELERAAEQEHAERTQDHPDGGAE